MGQHETPNRRVLLVEDNPGDVRLTLEAFKALPDPPELQVAREGNEAVDLLADLQGRSALPDLILLDLNMPGLDGRGVLSRLKSDPDLRRIPVAVLTTSEADRDVADAYDLHANCFLTKPVELRAFLDLVTLLDRFWLQAVRLPPVGEPSGPRAAAANLGGPEPAAGREPETGTLK